MTKATPEAVLSYPGSQTRELRPGRRHRLELSALLALFWLVLRQQCRARRLLILIGLLLLPSAIAVLVRVADPTLKLSVAEFGLVFMLLPHALVPLTALLYASGMIQDEIEDQTLTYLLIRPLPRWSIYLIKLLATLIVTVLLIGVFTLVTYLVLYWGSAGFWNVFPVRALKTASLFALVLVAYGSLLGLISLLTRRSLVAGAAYIIVFEGVLANIDFVIRKLSVMYYFRVLSERWIGIPWTDINDREIDSWAIDLSKAPTSANCLWTLLIASLVASVLGALIFTGREFRMKTPEGS
jgi:ABC-2 type transport system permease protein